jgi:hypothetical protein
VTNPTSDDGIDPFAPARANLFPGALPHIANWDEGRLEARSKVVWSSQALCISVWGAIAESEWRRAIVVDALDSAGIELDAKGEPKIECEVRGRRDVLNEYGGSNPTCPDAIIRWPGAALTVESKFTEPLGGGFISMKIFVRKSSKRAVRGTVANVGSTCFSASCSDVSSTVPRLKQPHSRRTR